jgi:TnpA family transposase
MRNPGRRPRSDRSATPAGRHRQAEQILRQFTAPARNTPTCTALVGLGRAVESVLVARYLRSEALGQEINDGLRVVENWNFAIPRCSPC